MCAHVNPSYIVTPASAGIKDVFQGNPSGSDVTPIFPP